MGFPTRGCACANNPERRYRDPLQKLYGRDTSADRLRGVCFKVSMGFEVLFESIWQELKAATGCDRFGYDRLDQISGDLG